jgi:putative redox protein
MAKPPIEATLVWQDELKFTGTSGQAAFTLDSKGVAGPSPMQSLLASLAGCMAIDVVMILQKGRHPLKALETKLVGQRADEEPRRYTAITLHFVITGDVPAAAIERAIELSHDKYCSVWHSMRQDIDLRSTFEVRP